MTAPELTLKNIQETPKVREVRVSDFLTTEQKESVIQKRATAKSKKARKYDAVDAYISEIIARFGYDAYKAWKLGEISEDLMVRMIYAERAREKRLIVPLETIIVASNAGANNPTKNKSTPKSLKAAIAELKSEVRRANENG